MKTDAILKADLIDIIFENKNKNYGAYSLRKFYNNRLYKALAAMFGLVVIFCLFSFMAKDKVVINAIPYDEPGFVPPPKDIKKPDAPKENSSPQKTAVAKAPTATQVFKTMVITDAPIKEPVLDLIPDTQLGLVKVTGKPGEVPKVTPEPASLDSSIGGGGGEKPTLIIDKITPTFSPEVMPAYPGGMDALRKFLQKNLANPQDVEEGQAVSVKIRFIIDFAGKLKGFETEEDGGTAFNNEVIRVLKKMPEWIPGKTKGQSVSVYYTIPVKFTNAD